MSDIKKSAKLFISLELQKPNTDFGAISKIALLTARYEKTIAMSKEAKIKEILEEKFTEDVVMSSTG